MKYSIEEYFSIANDNKTVMEITPNKDIEKELLYHHVSNKSKIVPIWEIIPEDALTITRPKELFQQIKIHYATEKIPIVVEGTSTYISLLNEEAARDFYIELKNHLDLQDLNAIFIILADYYEEMIFSNPKYVNSLQLVMIDGDKESISTPEVNIYPKDYCLDKNALNSYPDLIKSINDSSDYGCYVLSLDTNIISKVGLNKSIKATDSPKEIFEQMTGYYIEECEISIEPIFKECKIRKISISEYIDSKIQTKSLDPKDLFYTLYSNLNDPMWTLLCLHISKRLSTHTYLSKVLLKKPSSKTFIRCYVVETALSLINDPDSKKYALERSSTLKNLHMNEYEALISEFVSRTKDETNAICWLNCNTIEEKCELISRASKRDLKNGIPVEIGDLIPELKQYYADYEYATPELTNYYKKYRYFKIKNTLTSEFFQEASSIDIISTIQDRDQELSAYRGDTRNALLVVDGLSAEYIPFILSEFEKMNYNIEKCEVVKAHLPSSTDFNDIKWNDSRLPEIKGVDNTAHNGAIKNEKTSVERNLYESLRILKEELLNRVARELNNYSRIIITADHGTSRLAVIANELKYSRTLEWEGVPDDWRYSVAPNDLAPPEEFIKKRDVNKNVVYWVVKGYNRLPKPGGKKYELHGGATVEEILVPLIVISSTWDSMPSSSNDNKTTTKKPEQLREKDLFAELD